ncbi:hypothetical protein CMV_016268 [Castanea mollissima]|uniref:Uncharacterized protein n=1 Tax=Castanea mollissima TaxID=60419 RepID=A0A8J4QU75_9ROSI|nr:hypothetical protein CMV_016268 [Castanea mollissima]
MVSAPFPYLSIRLKSTTTLLVLLVLLRSFAHLSPRNQLPKSSIITSTQYHLRLESQSETDRQTLTDNFSSRRPSKS